LHELIDRPVVDGHANDRALQQPALLESVQGPERHHLCQVTGDAEDHEHISLLRSRSRWAFPSDHCWPPELVWVTGTPDVASPWHT
jgi:hypothetical protein